jgi:hypothetical protein
MKEIYVKRRFFDEQHSKRELDKSCSLLLPFGILAVNQQDNKMSFINALMKIIHKRLLIKYLIT